MLVLTERTEHLDAIQGALGAEATLPLAYSIRADGSPEGNVETELPLGRALLTRVQR